MDASVLRFRSSFRVWPSTTAGVWPPLQADGQFNISGFTNRQLRALLPDTTGRQLSVLLKRLYKHGLIKKVRHTYTYYLTALGKRVTAAALKLREMTIIPLLRGRIAR